MNTAQSSALDSGVPAHTPGPWHVCCYDEEKNAHVIQQEAGLLLSVAYTIGGLQGAQQAANARLIAAAPEMLEALQLARNVLFLLADEVKALGLRADNVPEKIAAALTKAAGAEA